MAGSVGLDRSKIIPREYQISIAGSIMEKGSTLVVLPTGLGKTVIAYMMIEEFSKKGKILFLAPTKPLARQHYKSTLQNMKIPKDDAVLLTGETPPSERKPLWKKKLVFSTPQTAKNDIEKGVLDFDFSICIFDEAHRAIGNYAYTFLAQKCAEEKTTVLGLTASPGGTKERINKIVKALGTKNIEIRTEKDSDVSSHVKPLEVRWVLVDLPPQLKSAKAVLEEMINESIQSLRKMGFTGKFFSKGHLVEMRKKIMQSNSNSKYAALSHFTSLFNLVHMLELLETQGTYTFLKYIGKLKQKDSKGAKRIMSDIRIIQLLSNLQEEHPKLEKLVHIAKKRKEKKMIVFAQYRDQIRKITEALNSAGIPAHAFLGKGKGVTQKTQKNTIDQFRKGDFDALVATSIGEEGLDIPSVDIVIFYEPIASEIRTIQRRGRAGRAKAGEVIVLITKGTKDETSLWASRAKEGKMKRIVSQMQEKKNPISEKNEKSKRVKREAEKSKEQKTLADYLG